MLSKDLEWGAFGNSGLTLSSQQIYIPRVAPFSFLTLHILFLFLGSCLLWYVQGQPHHFCVSYLQYYIGRHCTEKNQKIILVRFL
jgi:hypothetical protein